MFSFLKTVLTVSFTEENYTTSEGAGSVMVCITSSGDLALEVSATVNVASQSVTAQGNIYTMHG